MTESAIEQVRQGLKAGDPTEIMDLLADYVNDAQKNILDAYALGMMILTQEEPDEDSFDKAKKLFDEAAECLLDAGFIFNLNCLIDLLNCED